MKTEDYRNLSSELRKAADSIDRIVENKEDESIDSKTRKRRQVTGRVFSPCIENTSF